jgi:hypothetical protein
VVQKAELLQRCQLEDGWPLAKVGRIHVKSDRDVRLDVDHGNGGSG